MPNECPSCSGELVVTQLTCTKCRTDVGGRFAPSRLVNIPDPHASVLEMFLQVRGNVKEMERHMGLSYPTVRARLEEAFDAAGLGRDTRMTPQEREAERLETVRRLNRGEITAADAVKKLRDLQNRRTT